MAEEQTPKGTDKTTYQVLERLEVVKPKADEAGEAIYAWVEVGEPVTVGAGQKRQAIKAATNDRDEDGKRGVFVAVSVGSWKPEQRGVQLTDTWA